MTIDAVLDTLKSHLEVAQSKLDSIIQFPCIERCNTVVVFPETGLTIASDDDGKPVIQNSFIATQFTPEAAKALCQRVTNGRGEHPVAMSPAEYYRLQVNLINDSILLFESVKETRERDDRLVMKG